MGTWNTTQAQTCQSNSTEWVRVQHETAQCDKQPVSHFANNISEESFKLCCFSKRFLQFDWCSHCRAAGTSWELRVLSEVCPSFTRCSDALIVTTLLTDQSCHHCDRGVCCWVDVFIPTSPDSLHSVRRKSWAVTWSQSELHVWKTLTNCIQIIHSNDIIITQKKVYQKDWWAAATGDSLSSADNSSVHVSVCVCTLLLSGQRPTQTGGCVNCTLGFAGCAPLCLWTLKLVRVFSHYDCMEGECQRQEEEKRSKQSRWLTV